MDEVFRTAAPPSSPPILELDYEGAIKSVERIQHVLGVEAIRRQFPSGRDFGEPVGVGLRSIVKIASGRIEYTKSSVEFPIINELQIAIVDGAIERGRNGLIAYVVTQAPIRSIQEMIDRLRLSKLEYTSTSNFLSSDPDSPTQFVYEGSASFLEGEEVFDMASGRRVRIPATINCDLVSRANLHLAVNGIVGTIQNEVIYSGGASWEMKFSGNVWIRLA